MTGWEHDDPDWPGPPTEPPDEDTQWATGGVTSTDEDPPDDVVSPADTPNDYPATQEPPK